MEALKRWLQHRCSCQDSAHVNKDFGHIMTGNLSIIKDSRLRDLFKMGAKYRIPKNPDINAVFTAIMGSMSKLLGKLRNKGDPNKLKDFVSAYRNRLKILLEALPVDTFGYFWSNQMIMELKAVHAKYVICPADKAANNYVFICKKFYADSLCRELGVTMQGDSVTCSGNTTYKFLRDDNLLRQEKFSYHRYLTTYYNYQTDKMDNIFPMIYGTPKLHKRPNKFRFIAGAARSSTKPICLLVHRILTFIKAKVKAYCETASNTSGVNFYWAVDGSLEALKRITNGDNSITHVGAADFSTLYPSLPHDIIFQSVFRLIDLVVRDGYIVVKGTKVWNSKVPDVKDAVVLAVPEVKELIKESVEETYVTFAGFLFKQINGVPQGGSHSPTLASLTLTGLEFAFIKRNVREPVMRKLSTIIRYVDDIAYLNCPDFLSIAKEIYPAELPLESTGETDKKCNFLDMTLEIEQEFVIKPFDKTDEFPFKVNKYPHSTSNIHFRIVQNVYLGRLISFGRISTKLDTFVQRVLQLNSTMIKKGVSSACLKNKFLKFATEHNSILAKFGISSGAQLSGILQLLFC